MTEERRRWREYYEQKWPAEIHGYEETEERIAFISQQRKEAAREALEAAAREIEDTKMGKRPMFSQSVQPYMDVIKTGNFDKMHDFGFNNSKEEDISIINKHIEEL